MTLTDFEIAVCVILAIKSRLNTGKVLKLCTIPAGAVALVCFTLYNYDGIPVESTLKELYQIAIAIDAGTDITTLSGMPLLCAAAYHAAIGAGYAFAIGWIWGKIKGLYKSAERAVDKLDSKHVTTETHSYLPSGEEYFPDDYQ